MTKFHIRIALEEPEVRQCATLLNEYERSLPVSLAYQDFATELAQLPGSYAPPAGRLLLAHDAQGAAAGCIALRRLSASDAEIKRLYVRPEARGLGLGRRLVRMLITEAHSEGYARVRLDTLASMKSAANLYEALGFSETAAYYGPTPPGTRFFELELGASAGADKA